MSMGGGGSGYSQKDENKIVRLYLELLNDLARIEFLPRLVAIIKAECKRTGKSAIEVIHEGLKSGQNVIKKRSLVAIHANGLSMQESRQIVEEYFMRLARPSCCVSDEDSQTDTGKSLPSGGWDDNA